MNRSATLAATAAFLMFVASGPATRDALAAEDDIVGTWMPVSTGAYDPNPRGILIFTSQGRYSLTLLKQSLPKFAGNTRLQGSAEENKAVVQGSISHFGRYELSDGGKTLTLNIQASTYPNWDGVKQTRPFSVSGDTLTYKVAAPSAGGAPGEVVWRRAK
jgi:hypothetical protein